MQVQSIFSGRGDKVQTVGVAAFIGAGVLFALGFILMLAADGAFMSRQLPLILMTVAAIDVCFAAALSAVDLPSVEKTRLRALSIMGAVVVVLAATLIASSFRVGAFEIAIMLVALGGAPGMFKLGEILGLKLKTTAAPPAKSEAPPKPATAPPAAPTEGGDSPGA